MKHYNVEIYAHREKIFIIKLIRAVTHWGIKECKDWAEANFTFDEYMDPRATFKLRVTAEQLGHLAHFVTGNFSRADLTECDEISPIHNDPYDVRGDAG